MNLKTLALHVEEGAGAVESIALSLVGRVASWVGPLPIAIFTATETKDIFGVSPVVALASAVSLELVGMNLANRYLSFAAYNSQKSKSEPEANEKLAEKLMWTFYALDFSVCALIVGHRLWSGQPATNLIAAIYPLASALSILSMNQQIQHQRMQARLAAEKAERQATRQARKDEASDMQATGKPEQAELPQMQVIEPDYSTMETIDAIKAYYRANPLASQKQTAQVAGVSRARVGQVLADLEQSGAIRRNGHGVEVLG